MIILASISVTARAAPRSGWEATEHGLRDQVSSQKSVPYDLAARQRRYQVPAVSIAVIRDGRIIWTHAWGRAASDGKDRVDSHTLFEAASMTKPMTALVALRLVDRGILSLDEDVNARLLKWKLPFARGIAPQPVTLRQLLSHSAGVTVYGDLGYQPAEKRRDLTALLDGRMPDVSPPIQVENVPGTAMRYSNPGYVVIQQLIEDVTGDHFASVARREVLDPLGMRESYLEQPLTTRTTNVAQGSSGGAALPPDAKTATELGNGGLWSTPGDMAKLLIAIRTAYLAKPGALISPALAADMLRPQPGGWGLGIGVEGSGDALRFGHTGAFAGFESLMTAYAVRGDGLVLMTNAEGGQQLGAEIVRGLAAQYGWDDYAGRSVTEVALTRPSLRSLQGYYASATARAWISYHDGQAWLISDRGGWSRLLPLSQTRFVSAQNGVEVTATGPRSAPTPSITLTTPHGEFVLERRQYLPAIGPQLYIRGTMNGWDTSLPLKRGGRKLVGELALAPGKYQFKIASADWDAVDLGCAPSDAKLGPGGKTYLEHWGTAVTLAVPLRGRYRVLLDTTDETRPLLLVRRF